MAAVAGDLGIRLTHITGSCLGCYSLLVQDDLHACRDGLNILAPSVCMCCDMKQG